MKREDADRLAVELNERWRGRGARYEVAGEEEGRQEMQLDLSGAPAKRTFGGFYVRRVREDAAQAVELPSADSGHARGSRP